MKGRHALGIAFRLLPTLTAGFAILLGSSSHLRAAETVTLEDAIRTAMTANIVIQQQNLQVSGAEARVKEAAGAFDWTVGAESGFQTFFAPRAENGVLSDQTVVDITPYYSVNIGREFRDGISIRPGVTAYPGVSLSTAQTLGLTRVLPSLGITIPILRGLGEESADSGERAAIEALSATQFDHDFAAQRVVHDVVQAFWRCLATDQHAQMSLQSDRRIKDYDAVLQRLVDKGQVEPLVLQRASALDIARHLALQQANDEVQTCRRDLGLAVGGSEGETYPAPLGELPTVDQFGAMVDQLNEGALIDLAIERRADLQAAERTIAAAGARKAGAEDAKRPVLNLQIDPEHTFLRYTQSLENNTGEGLAAEAEAAESTAKLNLSQLQERIRADVTDAVRNLRRSRATWEQVSASEKQMEQVLADTEKRVNGGIDDRSNLLTAQDQLAQIQDQLISIRLQFASSLAALRLATGTVSLVDQSPAMVARQFTSLPGH